MAANKNLSPLFTSFHRRFLLNVICHCLRILAP